MVKVEVSIHSESSAAVTNKHLKENNMRGSI